MFNYEKLQITDILFGYRILFDFSDYFSDYQFSLR